MMNRRSFSTALAAGAAASVTSARGVAFAAAPVKTRNVARMACPPTDKSAA